MEMDQERLGSTAEIVAAYVAGNQIKAAELPGLIKAVYSALSPESNAEGAGPAQPLKPAVPIKKSVTPDHITCLEDGLEFKSLKRHLMTYHNLTPQDYRSKWGLDQHYPMVATNYAEARSALAKQSGLGQKTRKKTRGRKAASLHSVG